MGVQQLKLESVRRKTGGRIHLTPRVPKTGPVTTLCGQTLAAGTFAAAETTADCTNCIRRSQDQGRIWGLLRAGRRVGAAPAVSRAGEIQETHARRCASKAWSARAACGVAHGQAARRDNSRPARGAHHEGIQAVRRRRLAQPRRRGGEDAQARQGVAVRRACSLKARSSRRASTRACG